MSSKYINKDTKDPEIIFKDDTAAKRKDTEGSSFAIANIFSSEANTEAKKLESSAQNSLSDRLQGQILKSVMENYLSYYAKGQNHTAKAKRYDLGHFLEFLAKPTCTVNSVTVSMWTLQSTKDFIEYRLRIGDSPASVSRRLATIKHFGRTLAERVHDFVNPAREAKGPVLHSTRPQGLSENEIKLLKNVIENEKISKHELSFTMHRDIFLLELLLATGLRADEVRTLVIGQIGNEQKWLKNVKTKGKKFRNVYLDSDVRAKLKEYLIKREQEILKKSPSLLKQNFKQSELDKYPLLISFYKHSIFSQQSYALSPKTIWRIISNFGKKAQALSKDNISKFHPHKLRHTFAHGLLDSSKDVRLVAQALGHSDVRTTMRYTERGDEELAKAIEEKLSSKN